VNSRRPWPAFHHKVGWLHRQHVVALTLVTAVAAAVVVPGYIAQELADLPQP
jgi:hypothetical protein